MKRGTDNSAGDESMNKHFGSLQMRVESIAYSPYAESKRSDDSGRSGLGL